MTERVPELRFPGFEGEWEERRLSDYLTPRGERNRDYTFDKADVLSVSGEEGIVNQIDHMGRSYAGVDVGEYYVVQTGDVVYTKSPLRANPFGIVKVNHGPPGIVSTLYAVYVVGRTADPHFVDRFFELDDRTNAYLRPLVNKGAKNDMKISTERVLIDPVRFPKKPEQRKIASALAAVDAKLDALARERRALAEWKRGLAARLFDQTLRFRRDDGTPFPEWDEKRLGGVFDWVRTNSLSREALTNEPQRVRNIHYGDIHRGLPAALDPNEGLPFIRNKALPEIVDADFCRPGDIVIADASEDVADIGKAVEIVKQPRIPTVAGLHTILARPKSDDLVVGFAAHLFASPSVRSSIQSVAQGASILGLSKRALEAVTVILPSPGEQIKIASALSAVDASLNARDQRIRSVKKFKDWLLQNMFV